MKAILFKAHFLVRISPRLSTLGRKEAVACWGKLAIALVGLIILGCQLSAFRRVSLTMDCRAHFRSSVVPLLRVIFASRKCISICGRLAQALTRSTKLARWVDSGHQSLSACQRNRVQANSFCLDFVVRKKVSMNMTYAVVDSLPLPRAYSGSMIEREIARRALRLSAVGPEMEEFWNSTASLLSLSESGGSPVDDHEQRRVLRAELDVLVAVTCLASLATRCDIF